MPGGDKQQVINYEISPTSVIRAATIFARSASNLSPFVPKVVIYALQKAIRTKPAKWRATPLLRILITKLIKTSKLKSSYESRADGGRK